MTSLRTASRYLRPTLFGVPPAAAVLLGSYGVSRLGPSTLDAVPQLLLLALLGAGALACVLEAARRTELLAPFGIVALTVLVYFVARPLELSLSANSLTHSAYNYNATPLQTVLDLNAQEVTLYIDTRLSGSFDAAMNRALVALTLFFGVVLLSYRMSMSARAAAWLSRIGAGARELDLRMVIAGFLAIGLLGEAIVLGKVGGAGAALHQLGTQGNLAVSFIFLVVLNFYTAGLLMWICWHTPSTWGERSALGLAILELMVFYGLLGSRTLVLIPVLLACVAWNELVKPLSLRVLAPAAIVAVMFAASYLAVRESASHHSFSSAALSVPRYAVNVQAILNSSPLFDQFLEETNYIPVHAPYRYGGEIGQALLGQVPRFILPNKAQSTDTTFRQLIWGNLFQAGRPVGAAGEFYRDFGFPGIVIGGLLLGLCTRALSGLRPRNGPRAGRRLRTCLFVVGVLLLFQFLIGSYELLFGEALEIAIPLTLGLKLFARRLA